MTSFRSIAFLAVSLAQILLLYANEAVNSIESFSGEPTVTINTLFKPDKCMHKPKDGDTVLIHYTGTIHSSSVGGVAGHVFESTRGKRPFKFVFGGAGVIPGLNLGVAEMCVGERRVVVIPPSLGYGERGSRSLPPQATLQFEVELMSVQDKQATRRKQNVFREMDADSDGRIAYEEMQFWFAHAHPDRLQAIPTGVWERDDRNMDGYVSWEEFSGPKGHRSEL